MVKRYSGSRIDNVRVDQYGFLRTKGHATRVGVFKYFQADGSIIRELRHPDEVFKPESMKSLKNVPVTNTHPDTGKVTAENSADWTIGFTGDVARSDNFVETDIVIHDKRGIEAVQKGTQELSCGYDCELDMTPGVWEGEHYDAIQRNIEYNHLAIVNQGRAGPKARLKLDSLHVRLDSGDAVEVTDGDIEDIKKKEIKEKNMKKIKLGEKTYEVADEAASDLETLFKEQGEASVKSKQDNEDAVKKAKDLEDALKASQTKVDTLQAEVDLKKDVKHTDASDVQKLVRQRLNLERVATVALGSEAKLDEMDEKAIKVAVIKSVRKDFDETGKSEAYLDAAFDLATEEAKKANREGAGSRFTNTTNDNQDGSDSEKARKTAQDDAKNAWKKPLSIAK